MNRTATTEDLKALIAAQAAEIAGLKVENEKLAQRVVHLEEVAPGALASLRAA